MIVIIKRKVQLLYVFSKISTIITTIIIKPVRPCGGAGGNGKMHFLMFFLKKNRKLLYNC